MSSLDDENFQPPPGNSTKGVKTTLELVPSKAKSKDKEAEKDEPKLPPGLVVKGLRTQVRLIWKPGLDGQPVGRVVYE
jgi:hypothetical protein